MLTKAQFDTDIGERGVIKQSDRDRAYELIGLIGTCELAIEELANLGDDLRLVATGNIGSALSVAHRIAGELCDLIQFAAERQTGDQS